MNTFRRALLTSVTAASVVLLAAWALPASPQEPRAATAPSYPPVAIDGNYTYTDTNGSYQAALDGAVLRAQTALSHANGQNISDLQITWQVLAVTGVRGGIAGRREITVTVHIL